MKVKGLKNLNSNWYDSIMIRNLYSFDTKMDIKSKDKIKTIKVGDSFYDGIKNLEDKDKIGEIVKYYLRNNEINNIKDKEKLDYYEGYFQSIIGSRDLYLQLREGSLDKEIFDEIVKKYQKDRLDYLYNNKFKNIEIYLSSNEMYYYTYNDSRCFGEVGEEVLSIALKTKDGKMLPFEEKFYNEFIEYLLKDCEYCYAHSVGYSNVFFKSYEGCKFHELPGYYLITDKYYVRIDRKLYNFLWSDIYYKSKKDEEVKKLQLKLEVE